MNDRELRARRGADLLADRADVPRLVRRDPEPQRLRVHQRVVHAAVGHVDPDRARALDLDGRVEVLDEGRDVPELHLQDPPAAALAGEVDETGGGLEGEPGHRLAHRQDPGLEDHRHRGDGVGAGHGRVLFRLHDDVAEGGLGVVRREHQVRAVDGGAAGLVEEELPEAVGVIAEVSHLVEHRPAGDVHDAPGHHLGVLPLGMHADHRVDSLPVHRSSRSRGMRLTVGRPVPQFSGQSLAAIATPTASIARLLAGRIRARSVRRRPARSAPRSPGT